MGELDVICIGTSVHVRTNSSKPPLTTHYICIILLSPTIYTNKATMALSQCRQNYHNDAQMCDMIESHFLTEQVEAIKQIGDYITKLKRVGPGLGEFMFDKELKGESS